METLAVRIASLTPVTVKGTWLRHSDAGYPQRALDGHTGYGRWGTKRGFDVLYLGEPEPSVIVEAYRHFIDPIEDPAMLAEIRPRILITAGVMVDEVLDLTSAGARMTTGLSLEILQSDTDDHEAYERCQEVAQVAHQLGRRGILAPAATKMGRTLALFSDLTASAGQMPSRIAPDVLWESLPPDPRVLERRHGMRIVPSEDSSKGR